MQASVDLLAAAQALDELWSPRVVARTNGQLVKVAKLHGEFVWHDHAAEDELFLVLAGELAIHFEDRKTVRLAAGQMYVVPRGVRHNPVASNECLIALIEPESTAHTGDVVSDRTRSLAEQMDGAAH